MQFLLPTFEGRITAKGVPHDFASRLAERVRTGLIVPGSRRRANYTIASEGRDRLVFRAADVSTAISVGLNEVEVERRDGATLAYRVRYWRWTLYGVGLCAAICVVLTVYGLVWGRDDIRAHAFGPLLFWAQVVFWGLAWPWILTAVHKPFATRTLEGILRDILEASGLERG
jgi:hypothetical protein